MLTGISRSIASFGAGSTFEKARLAATFKGDLEPPHENDILTILYTLSGKDPETRPQIAYTTILQKLESSQSKNRWNYLVKNLIILDRMDRCVDQRFFVQDIQALRIAHVENYTEKDQHFQNKMIEDLIKQYFRYIKVKALLYSKKNTSFNMSRDEVKEYFAQLFPNQIFDEVGMAQKLHDLIMDISACTKKGLLKWSLNQYVFLLFLQTLAAVYSMQYKAFVALMEKLCTMDVSQVIILKDLYTKFLKQNEELIQFVNQYKYVQGFGQINIKDVIRVDPRVLGAIEDYNSYLSGQNQGGLPEEIIFNDDQHLIFDELEQTLNKSVAIFKEAKDEKNKNSTDTILKDLEETSCSQNPPSPKRQVSQKSKNLPQYNIKVFDQFLESKQFKNIENEAFKKYNNDMWKTFTNNYSTQYSPIDKQFISEHDISVHKQQGLSSYLTFKEEQEPVNTQLHRQGSSMSPSRRFPQSPSTNNDRFSNPLSLKSNISNCSERIYESEFDKKFFNSFTNNYSRNYVSISDFNKDTHEDGINNHTSELLSLPQKPNCGGKSIQKSEDKLLDEDAFEDFLDQTSQQLDVSGFE